MHIHELCSERILFGLLIIVGYLLLVGTVVWVDIPKEAEMLLNTAIGTLGTAVGMVVQSVFRSDKTDKANAETMATLSKAVGGQS